MAIPDSRISLKRIKFGCQTKTIAQISKALHRNDPADYWDALLTPLIRRFLSTAGTSEFGHFQETHEFPRQRHPPVAYAWERELAVCEVVRPRRRPGGPLSSLTLLTTSGLSPRCRTSVLKNLVFQENHIVFRNSGMIQLNFRKVSRQGVIPHDELYNVTPPPNISLY